MKHITTLVAALLLAVPALSNAQTPPVNTTAPASASAHNGKEGGGEKMFQELNLTPEQQTQIAAIRDRVHHEIGDIRAKSAITDTERDNEIKAAIEKSKQEMDAILTPEQQAKLKELRQERKAARKGNGAAAPTPAAN